MSIVHFNPPGLITSSGLTGKQIIIYIFWACFSTTDTCYIGSVCIIGLSQWGLLPPPTTTTTSFRIKLSLLYHMRLCCMTIEWPVQDGF